MASFYNPKHDAVLYSNFQPVDWYEAKQKGAVTPHYHAVQNIRLIQNVGNGGHRIVWLTRETIIDLYNQIQEIEETKTDCEVDLF